MPDTEAPDQGQVMTLVIDGAKYVMENLTFRERKQIREYIRQLADDEDLALEDAMFDDLVVAFVTVVKQRKDSDYTLEDAMDIQFDDVIKQQETPDPEPEGDGPPPTARGRKPRATASTAKK